MNIKKRTIEDEVDHILDQLKSMSVDSEEYRIAVQNLEVLCKAESSKTNRNVNPDTIVYAITNLVGILLILNHERLNIISTKAVGLLMKGRL